jgi:hypothetical protein
MQLRFSSMLNGVGDILDLLPALHEQQRPDYLNMDAAAAEAALAKRGMCSALSRWRATALVTLICVSFCVAR